LNSLGLRENYVFYKLHNNKVQPFTAKLLLQSAALILLMLFSKLVVADVSLVIFEAADCPYCAKWNHEISQIYPKTQEGKVAPLKRYDLYEELPEIKFQTNVRFTPTFVLTRDNEELGRIEGYSNDEQFWILLNSLLEESNISLNSEKLNAK